MRLELNDLKDKNLPGISTVLGLSFEYLLADISKEYALLNKYSTVEEFNQHNRLEYSKTLLYPFFVSLSNGHSESLYNLFGEFYSLSFGPVSFNLFEIINRGGKIPRLTYFATSSEENPLGIQVTLSNDLGFTVTTNISSCFETIKRRIKETSLSVKGETLLYQDITILSDKEKEKELFGAIESGVKAIKDQSTAFFNADMDVMKLHASYFGAIRKRINMRALTKIDYTELEEGKKRPFYAEDILD